MRNSTVSMVWVTRKRRILRRKPSGSSKLETKVTKNSKRNWNVVRRRNLVARETRVGQSRAIRDTNKFTFQLRFIIDVVKSGPTYRVKSREIPLSAHWPCAIIDRATAGGVGRFHNRKGAINVPCNDLNSWIIPAEDRRGFFLSPFPPIFLPYFPRPLPSTEFGSLSLSLPSSLSLGLIRENPLRECLLLRSRSEGRLMKFRDVRVSFNFVVGRWYDRGERSICLWEKKKRIEVVTIKVIIGSWCMGISFENEITIIRCNSLFFFFFIVWLTLF